MVLAAVVVDVHLRMFLRNDEGTAAVSQHGLILLIVQRAHRDHCSIAMHGMFCVRPELTGLVWFGLSASRRFRIV